MKFLRIIVAVMAASVLAPSLRAADGGEVVWWEVSDSIQLDGVDMNFSDLKVRDPNSGEMTLSVNGARLRYGDTYLDIYAFTDDNSYVPVAGAIAPGPGTYFSTLSSDAATYSYVLELGNWTGSEWLTGMVSGEMTYEQLMAGQYITNIENWSGITSNYATPWAPTAYSVPEPSSGLLLLIGGASLLLRRRRKKA